MQIKIASFLAVPALAFIATILLQPSAAFDPLTFTVGSTAYVLTGTQVAVALGGLAALAIAKEKIIFNELSRGRGKREVNDLDLEESFGPFFDAIAIADVSDCGKLLVCLIKAKPEEDLTADDVRVSNLFVDLDHLASNPNYASYQVAAMIGSHKMPHLCYDRFAQCPVGVQGLETILNAHSTRSQGVRI